MVNNRVLEDIHYTEGQWNSSALFNDKQIPTDSPLYVITKEGFVISRRLPIHGFLDVSDIRFSSSFTIPQTITTPINEQWRLYSRAIIHNKQVLGSVVVGYHQPEMASLQEIDYQLRLVAEQLLSKVTLDNQSVSLNPFDERSIPSRIAFEIVTTGNRSLVSSGSLPNYIDRSYVGDLLTTKLLTVQDSETNEPFLVAVSPVISDTGEAVGTVVSAVSLRQFHGEVWNQLFFSVIAGGLFAGALLLGVVFLLRGSKQGGVRVEVKTTLLQENEDKMQQIEFDKEVSQVVFYGKILKIPYASNQYQVCKVLFSNPKKRWEYDEILDKMLGEDSFGQVKVSWRKVYDAVRAVNRKSQQTLGIEIIDVDAKTFKVVVPTLGDSN